MQYVCVALPTSTTRHMHCIALHCIATSATFTRIKNIYKHICGPIPIASLQLSPPHPFPKTVPLNMNQTHARVTVKKKLGTSVAAIAAANNIKNVNRIKVGQKLTIPGSEPAAASAQDKADIEKDKTQ